MDLFEQADQCLRNYLPRDGVVYYYGKIFSNEQADLFFRLLSENINWQHDEARIYGKHIITKRKVAWHGDKPYAYRYSNTQKVAQAWSPILLEIKNKIEAYSGEIFNACLLNLYHSGEDGMSWHSDAEKELKKSAAIASLSFGAARQFYFKHKKNKEKVSLVLEHGSLLVMKGKTQEHWLHSLPKSKQHIHPRINLTFRTMLDQ